APRTVDIPPDVAFGRNDDAAPLPVAVEVPLPRPLHVALLELAPAGRRVDAADLPRPGEAKLERYGGAVARQGGQRPPLVHAAPLQVRARHQRVRVPDCFGQIPMERAR